MAAFTSDSPFTGKSGLAEDLDPTGFRNGIQRFLENRGFPSGTSTVHLDPFVPQSPPLTAKRLRGPESARRRFEAASLAKEQGVPTLKPLAWVQHQPDSSVLFTQRIPGAVSFQEALLTHYYEKPFCEPLMNLLQVCADAVRTLHETGWSHGDLTNEKILVQADEKGDWEKAWIQAGFQSPMVPGSPCSASVRGRDSAKIDLPSDFLRVFLEMQWAPDVVPAEARKAEKACRAKTGTPPPGLPSGRTVPAEKDIWIWDHRSKQAIPALKSRDKRKYYRKRDALAQLGAACRWSPSIRRETKACMQTAWTQPVDLDQKIGISLNLEPDRFEKELKWLEPLGNVPVLVRFYHHESEANRRYALEAVRRLHSEGHAVTVGLIQDRRAVLSPAQWHRFVEWAAGGLSGFAEALEIGHAVNRVKWGIWNIPEYRELLAPFENWQNRYPQLPLLGPAGIDFEFLRVLPMLHTWPAGSLSGFSHHMYVDRRGAPENTQSGYDLVRKLAMARAISRVHPACEEKVIVSEVNWPLAGTGVWSPVGSPYQSPGERTGDPSVDEDTYADYLKRYLTLSLCSGMADKVYWWNLVAHGFGLVDDRDPVGWRPRPGYHAFKQMVEAFRGSQFQTRTESKEGWTYLFTRGDESFTTVIAHLNPKINVD